MKQMKRNVKLLVLFGMIISMYVYIIISMYDPKMMEMMDNFAKLMPELMAAMGMTTDTANLMAFMISYLYGFILLIFPMVFSILRGHGLVAAYVDKGSMASLLAAPVKRRTIILTQMAALISGIVILVVYSTVLEYACAGGLFPGELPDCYACSCLSEVCASWLPQSFPIPNTVLVSAPESRHSCM